MQATAFGPISITWVDTVSANLTTRIHSLANDFFAPVRTEAEFNAATQHLLQAFAAQGYRHVRLSPRDFQLRDGRLCFDLHIRPGPRSRVAVCTFAGLSRTDTTWLHKQLSPELDVPLTASWLRQTSDKLSRLASVRIAAEPEIIELERTRDEITVLVRWPMQERAATRFDGLLAAGGGSGETELTGRAALQFDGLFGRDRSVALRFNRPRPQWRTLEIKLSERGAFGQPFDWTVDLREDNQLDRRQKISGQVSSYLSRTRPYRIRLGTSWQRITPGTSQTVPARTLEAEAGFEKSAPRWQAMAAPALQTELSAVAVYSRRSITEPGGTADRLRLESRAGFICRFSQHWDLRLTAAGRYWTSGRNRLGPGDEWYLGGTEYLRGHDDHSIAAESGLWSMLEIGHWLRPSLGLALFGEAAHLTAFDTAANTIAFPDLCSYGCAVQLLSAERIGRLEFAWNPQASLRDGIVRLRISQAW